LEFSKMLTLILLALLVLIGFPAAAFGVQVWLERRYDRDTGCRTPSIAPRRISRRL
jgi:hypothetical protein